MNAGEGKCPVVLLVFKTSLGIVRSSEGSTPSLLRHAALVSAADLELLQALEDRIDLAAARRALKGPGRRSWAKVKTSLVAPHGGSARMIPIDWRLLLAPTSAREVTAQIGVGGMGEVYKATDTNLKRAVAVKVLPASVAADADRLARFQRAAEVLAALNHPNIAAVYGLERSGATTALVMELVEGRRSRK